MLVGCGGGHPGARYEQGANRSSPREDPRVVKLRAKLQPVDTMVAAGNLDDAMFLLASFSGHDWSASTSFLVKRAYYQMNRLLAYV